MDKLQLRNEIAQRFELMAGKQGASGRRALPGTVYKFKFYFRYMPGRHTPELQDVLEALKNTRGRKRRDIWETVLLRGAGEAKETAANAEDSEAVSLLSDMFTDF